MPVTRTVVSSSGRIQVELNQLDVSFPERCPCCFGPAEIEQSLSVTRSRERLSWWTLLTMWGGILQFDLEVEEWSWPIWYCRGCYAHVKRRDHAVGAAASVAILGTIAWCCYLVLTTNATPWTAYVAGMAPVALLATAIYLAMTRLFSSTSPTCTAPETGATGTNTIQAQITEDRCLRLKLTNADYARALVELHEEARSDASGLALPG